MEEDHVVWAAAFALLRRHDRDAPAMVAARIGELAMAGDQEGVMVWRSIAACMDRLIRAPAGKAN